MLETRNVPNILVEILKGWKHFKDLNNWTVEGKETIKFNFKFWSFHKG